MDVFNQLSGYFRPETNSIKIDAHQLAMKLASDSIARREDDGLYQAEADGTTSLTDVGQRLFDRAYDEYIDIIKSFKAI